jgi:hypothetical protein
MTEIKSTFSTLKPFQGGIGLLTVLFLLVFGLRSEAQILNDTVQNIYGPEQVLVSNVRGIRLSEAKYQPVDTSLQTFHRFHLRKKLLNRYQDLGNHGTALFPIFFEVPSEVGTTFGYNAYKPYFKGPDEFEIYDTRSPFTHLFPVFGGAGRSTLDVTYTRNVTEYWNLGFNFGTMRLDKQLAAKGRGDRNVESNSYDGFMHYSDSSQRYQAVVLFSRRSHGVAESGGIVPTALDPESEPFQYRDARVLLADAGSRELRQNIYLYQEYTLTSLLGIWASVERLNHVVGYQDVTSGQNEFDFYDTLLINTGSTNHRSKFSENKAQGGIKGEKGGLFYSAYYKNRILAYQPSYLSEDRRTEHFLGGDIRLVPNDRLRLDAGGEINQFGQFRLDGKLQIFDFEAAVHSSSSAPSFFMQRNFNNHSYWENNFVNMQAEQLKARYQVRTGPLRIAPKVSVTRVSNYLYINANKEAAQGQGSALHVSPGLDFSLGFANKLHLDGELIFTQLSGEDADLFRIPTWFSNASLYYSNELYNGKIGLHVGLDIHYKSAWYGNAYDPVNQQFYLQNDFEIPGYVWADLVGVFKINRTRIFTKITHINQGFMQEEGYYITPGYTGIPRIFDLGISWMFFD